MRLPFPMPPWARLGIGLAAAFPAASLVALGLSQSGLGETRLHRAIERLGDGGLGTALDVLWHPLGIVGGLAIALLLNLGRGRHPGAAPRVRVAGRLLAIACVGLAAVIFLYLLAENTQLFRTLRR